MFRRKKKTRGDQQRVGRASSSPPPAYADSVGNERESRPQSTDSTVRRIAFHCQLAHGSPTGIVSEFSSIRQLYEMIAECFDIDSSEILFCTLNSHKLDMTKLMCGQLALDDFIFAHIKGRPKVVEIEKAEDALGLTIADNGAGYAFIKAIKPDSVASKIEGIYVGDHIEKIDDCSVVGSRHHEVARVLKSIPKGSMFTIRVIEPMRSGFSEIGAKSLGTKKGQSIGTGKETLRLSSKGPAKVEVIDEVMNVAVEKINFLLESFLGISDADLAQTIWEIGSGRTNPSDLATALQDSDLSDFGFTDSFVFDVWGAISDAKQGRLQKTQEFMEQF